ncbi:glycosyl hydrolase [Flavivirga aquatica]|uniref:Glycosyl hydrolase n=1 Tax=Flavivirga aquatica TaxID=1849968 RepID=A0A1E5SHT1_9FLAO|nr:sugar-binding domain-containing protein [Flavivirga aquatica]OEJ98671.1 glycosyl hydrolase [Flavivirga aquatica]
MFYKYNKIRFSFIFLLVTSFMVAQKNNLPRRNISTQRTKYNLNLGWKFHLGNTNEHPESVNFNDSNWESVSVPHTLQLVSYEMDSIQETWVQKKYLRDFGWYRKQVFVDDDHTKKVFLEFEGVHNATELWVNGKSVGDFKVNGYVPFHFDITNFVNFGEDNLIVIKADNSFNKTIAPDPHRTDYIKFGGLYRDLYLVTTNKLHVNFNWEDYDAGVHITTPTVNKNNGTVSIKTTVKNENSTSKNCKIVTKIIDAKGYVLKTIVHNKTIEGNSNYTFRQTTTIEDNFHLWSPNTPYLYRSHSVIYNHDKPVDFVENTFGFRSFKLVKGKGFVLNENPIFLIGANRHQNYPNIGDAIPNSFHYNEALQYKKAGFNIIRLSHYTQDDAFIKACDELGILVYEEPSTWIMWSDDLWFSKLEDATRHMIRNHRNHPSIVFWGAGINHRGPVPRMQNTTKEEDPFRLTASASSPWNGVKNEGVTDIHATMDYRRSEFPEGAFSMVMEHGSSVNADVNQFHISRYKKSKNNIAAIAWVGADYNRLQPDKDYTRWKRGFTSQNGILSAYRIPKPVYYWYQSELIKKPIVHIADETASNTGKIRVFSNCQMVALYHDNLLIAKQFPDNNTTKSNLNHPSFTFNYKWKKGRLKAVGYNNDEIISEHSRSKQETPHHIALKFNINNQPFFAGGSDIRMVHAYILDKNNEIVTSSSNNIEFSVSGAGSIIDNGHINANPASPHNGVATIYIKGSENTGSITVSAKSKGLKPAKVSISTQPFNTNEITKNAKPIYDYPISKVDIGGKQQLVQFDWLEWTEKSNNDLEFLLNDYNAKIEITSTSKINWLGDSSTMLGDLSFMGADGIYIEKGVLKLKISNLKEGLYNIETFHHARKNNTKKLTNNIEVTITDVSGKFTTKAEDHIVNYYENDNTGERKPLSVKSKFKIKGNTPVILEFKNIANSGQLWVNGFVLRRLIN